MAGMVEEEEGRTYGDPILEALQRLQRLVETRTAEGGARSPGREH